VRLRKCRADDCGDLCNQQVEDSKIVAPGGSLVNQIDLRLATSATMQGPRADAARLA